MILSRRVPQSIGMTRMAVYRMGSMRIISAPEEIEEDSIILIASDCSEAEVFPTELSCC